MVKHLDIESEIQAVRVKTNIRLVKEPHTFFLMKITLSLSWPVEFVFGYELFPLIDV